MEPHVHNHPNHPSCSFNLSSHVVHLPPTRFHYFHVHVSPCSFHHSPPMAIIHPPCPLPYPTLYLSPTATIPIALFFKCPKPISLSTTYRLPLSPHFHTHLCIPITTILSLLSLFPVLVSFLSLSLSKFIVDLSCSAPETLFASSHTIVWCSLNRFSL